MAEFSAGSLFAIISDDCTCFGDTDDGLFDSAKLRVASGGGCSVADAISEAAGALTASAGPSKRREPRRQEGSRIRRAAYMRLAAECRRRQINQMEWQEHPP